MPPIESTTPISAMIRPRMTGAIGSLRDGGVGSDNQFLHMRARGITPAMGGPLIRSSNMEIKGRKYNLGGHERLRLTWTPTTPHGLVEGDQRVDLVRAQLDKA